MGSELLALFLVAGPPRRPLAGLAAVLPLPTSGTHAQLLGWWVWVGREGDFSREKTKAENPNTATSSTPTPTPYLRFGGGDATPPAPFAFVLHGEIERVVVLGLSQSAKIPRLSDKAATGRGA